MHNNLRKTNMGKKSKSKGRGKNSKKVNSSNSNNGTANNSNDIGAPTINDNAIPPNGQEANSWHTHIDTIELPRSFGTATPPIEPGRRAKVHGLVNRSDLNSQIVTIKKLLDNGRVACEVVHLRGTHLEKREVISIRPQNLEVKWNVNESSSDTGNDMLNGGLKKEECPICFDTIMNSGIDDNTVNLECCGKKICKLCFVNTQFTKQRDVCPMCRADTSDTR